MRTRSSSNLIVESSTISKRRNRRRSKQIVNPSFELFCSRSRATTGDTRSTTNLKNDITNFQQRFDETFSEAWDRFIDLLRKCPHHGFLELHQIDTFYNALTQSDQDSLNAAAGGNLLNRTPRDALTIIENKSKVCTLRNKPVVSKVSATTSFTPAYLPEITALTDAVKAMLLQNKTPSLAHVKAMEETCVTCGGPHPYYECLATDGNTFNASAAIGTYNQAKLKNEIQTTMMNQNNELKNIMSSFIQMHSPSGLGSLLSNTISNQRGDLKVITTRSGVSYDGEPTIPPTSSSLTTGSRNVNRGDNGQDTLLHMSKFASTFKSLLSNKEKLFELAKYSIK
ncbi:reverse transcriptase domain-containing protein [Tanacetum coccineum]|uniref:Reverse transcriptase domain-containing protein n=1 Tax=Tanacetum coccineum TaxID=301880 RepID=A0ABQ5E368_9ASTR